MTGTTVIGVFSLFAAVGALCLRWRTQRSQSWPTVEARVVETPPKSIFEREENQFYLNLDTDYFLEYEVSGKAYRKRVIEDNARFMGIKVWRRTMPERLLIRYNPHDPSDYVQPLHDFVWLFVMLLAVFGLGVFFVLKYTL